MMMRVLLKLGLLLSLVVGGSFRYPSMTITFHFSLTVIIFFAFFIILVRCGVKTTLFDILMMTAQQPFDENMLLVVPVEH
jgi:hypothetical protein